MLSFNVIFYFSLPLFNVLNSMCVLILVLFASFSLFYNLRSICFTSAPFVLLSIFHLLYSTCSIQCLEFCVLFPFSSFLFYIRHFICFILLHLFSFFLLFLFLSAHFFPLFCFSSPRSLFYVLYWSLSVSNSGHWTHFSLNFLLRIAFLRTSFFSSSSSSSSISSFTPPALTKTCYPASSSRVPYHFHHDNQPFSRISLARLLFCPSITTYLPSLPTIHHRLPGFPAIYKFMASHGFRLISVECRHKLYNLLIIRLMPSFGRILLRNLHSRRRCSHRVSFRILTGPTNNQTTLPTTPPVKIRWNEPTGLFHTQLEATCATFAKDMGLAEDRVDGLNAILVGVVPSEGGRG